jgi:hypothetical protein
MELKTALEGPSLKSACHHGNGFPCSHYRFYPFRLVNSFTNHTSNGCFCYTALNGTLSAARLDG